MKNIDPLEFTKSNAKKHENIEKTVDFIVNC